jgi:hypothetical protein
MENDRAVKTPMTTDIQPTRKILLRQPDLVTGLLITLFAVWLHLHLLAHAGGLWRDEVNLLNLSSRPSLNDMAKDSFPVLMPLLVRAWSAVGLAKSDLSVRVLGALIGLGILAALWTAARAARRPAPLLGLALLGLNSTMMVYGDSLRAYGLGSLLIVLTTAAAWMFLKQPSATRTAWLTLGAVLSVQALYQNAILVVAICAGAWAVCARRKDRRAAARILLAGVVAAASLLPYLPILVPGHESTTVLRTGLHLVRAATNFSIATGFPLEQYPYVWVLLAAVVMVGGGATLRRHVTASTELAGVEDLRLFAGTALCAALAGFAGFLWFAALPTQPWYFLPLMAVAAVCFDAGLPRMSGYLRAAFFGFVIATVLIAIPTARRDLDYHFTNVDVVAQRLNTEAAPRDSVVVTPWYCGVTFERYFKGATPWTTLPPLEDHSTHRYDLVRMQMQNPNAIRPVLDQITATLQAGNRVWVVAGESWMGVPPPGPSPPNLPPPPLKNSGWSDLPYSMAWTAQVAHFLSNHSLQFERITIPMTGHVNVTENMELFVARGWQISADGPASPHPPPEHP